MSLTYHAGLPVDPDEAARRRASGLPVYQPTDPKPIDQRPYLDFIDRDQTPAYQKDQT